MFSFKIIKKDNKTSARSGIIKTSHGSIKTPVFMPVGTRATVKTLSQEELKKLGTEIILGNTYHLYLRPGNKLIKKMGGLHKFMNWDKPILTDSGGYQVFSLAQQRNGQKNLVKINEKEVVFTSHLDGSKHIFSPEKVIDIEYDLGVDIAMPLDWCPSADADEKEIEKAVNLTTEWFERAFRHLKKKKGDKPALFPIIQGGAVKRLRELSYNELSKFDSPGYSIGGVANAGESKLKQRKALEYTIPLIPENKPRYLMGVGEPEDILEAVERGVDMFDCVMPTRMARNGAIWTKQGRIDVSKARFKEDKNPLEKNCECYSCKNYTKSYIHHLLREKEVLGIRLTTIHNIHFMLQLMDGIRRAIETNNFAKFKRTFLLKFKQRIDK
ncbi:tRNA guanosine(34) transglycosylase Tgt [bacterium]|nr:tRNA guanosine(34) transglycosylase Tgt [bacterium]